MTIVTDQSTPVAAFTPPDDLVLPSVNNPGMISGEEEKLYYWISKHRYRGDRLTLEIGTWLGRSTQRICDGLDEVAEDWTLHCYDGFNWSKSYKARALGKGADGFIVDLDDGDSFEPAFRFLMGPARSDKIVTHRGRVEDIESVLKGAWPEEMRLGLLFVDASKGWHGNVALLKALGDRMVPGEGGTTILFQDFLYFPAYKLIFLTQLLPFLKIESYCRTGSSVTMAVTETPDLGLEIFREGSIKSQSESSLRAAWSRFCSAIPSERRVAAPGIDLAFPLMLWECGHLEAASAEFAKVEIGENRDFVMTKLLGSGLLERMRPLRELLR